MSDVNSYWRLPQPDSLGELVGADDVRNAVKATILEWSPYYLAIVSSRLEDSGIIGGQSQQDAPLPDFGVWENDPEHRSLGTGQPAAFLVTVPATVGSPDVQGSGQIRTTFRAQVVLQVFGTTWEKAADLTSWYEKAARWCILQHRSLGGFAASTKWIGNQYSGKIHTSTRTEAQAVMAFDIQVANAIEIGRGPQAVPSLPLPPDDDPTVATTVTTVTNETVDEGLEPI